MSLTRCRKLANIRMHQNRKVRHLVRKIVRKIFILSYRRSGEKELQPLLQKTTTNTTGRLAAVFSMSLKRMILTIVATGTMSMNRKTVISPSAADLEQQQLPGGE